MRPNAKFVKGLTYKSELGVFECEATWGDGMYGRFKILKRSERLKAMGVKRFAIWYISFFPVYPLWWKVVSEGA